MLSLLAEVLRASSSSSSPRRIMRKGADQLGQERRMRSGAVTTWPSSAGALLCEFADRCCAKGRTLLWWQTQAQARSGPAALTILAMRSAMESSMWSLTRYASGWKMTYLGGC